MEGVFKKKTAAYTRCPTSWKVNCSKALGKGFKYFVEVNLESQPSIRQLFTKDIDVHRTCEAISATLGIPVVAGKTLLL